MEICCLYMFRSSHQSLNGVLAGYHGVPDGFLVSIAKDTTQLGHTETLRLNHAHLSRTARIENVKGWPCINLQLALISRMRSDKP